ncbi:MAG: chorismate mutase [Spirochaeta sp. LUC14_002_19_P3]|nr:MAG: chorismate mutase [Spirochaeta sp. LUC14_002_19_P3]
MEKTIIAVRGAVSIDESRDESQAMAEAVGQLLEKILSLNNLDIEDIISIQFTQTADLKQKNAASALRESRSDYNSTPLFCAQEPAIEGMLPRIVRVMLTGWGRKPVKPVYLGETSRLRPDCKSPDGESGY